MGKPFQPMLQAFSEAHQEDWRADITRFIGAAHDITPVKTAAHTVNVTTNFVPCDTTSAGFTVTLPPAYPMRGKPYTFKNTGTANDLTIAAASGDTIDGSATATVTFGNSIILTSDGVNKWYSSTNAGGGGGDCHCPDLDPVAIHFPFGNTAIGYDLTNAGSITARTYDITLGTGGVTYNPEATNRSAIYNIHDDCMYFLATRTESAVDTPVIVRFDPRALVVEAYGTLPAGSTSATAILVDVTDERAWIVYDETMYAYDTITLTEVFNDGGSFAAIDSNSPAGISCRSGQLIIGTDGDATTIHLMTVTGPTTYIDTPITVIDGGGGHQVLFSNNGSYRRRWIGDRNKVFLMYDNVPDGGIMFALIDLNDLSVQTTYSPAGSSYDLSDPGPYWDHYGQRMCGSMFDSAGGGHYGIFIGSDTGVTLGFAGYDSADYDTGIMQPLGGTVLAASFIAFALAGFSNSTISTTPSEIFETSDSFTSPGLNVFDVSHVCVAPRRRVPLIPTPF